MSTAIAKNLQVGSDPTATNNFTIFQPATPDGTLRIGNGNTGITTSLLTLNSSGNLGLGVTPSAWDTLRAFDIGSGGGVWGTAAQAGLGSNVYYGTGNFRYKATNVAAALQVDGNVFKWLTAPSGTAGNAISFTQAMTLDASGNLGVGTTSPTAKLTIQSAGNSALIIRQNTSVDRFRLFVGDGTSGYTADENFIASQNTGLHFMAGASGTTEVMQLTSGGNLLVGKTAVDVTTQGVVIAAAAGTSIFTRNGGAGCIFVGNSNQNVIEFNYSNTTVGTIAIGPSSTAYNTSSDYRLKNTIAPMTGALAKVALLKPVTYKWNADGSDGEGFIAHELAEIVPDAVTGTKDAVDADGKPVYQGIDTSFLVATLTAAIQELKAEFDAYKATHP